MDPQWLQWAKMLQSMAQTGLTYASDPYDIERYKALQELAFEIMAANAHIDVGDVRRLFEAESGHATPKVDVRAAVFKDNKILMVKERSDGGWTLPGGWADVGEAPAIAAVREAWEESGYQVRATRLLAVYDRDKHGHPPLPYHIYKIFFECELLGGKPTTSSETDDVAFFAEDELPPLSLTRIVPAQIQRFFAMHRDPTAAADFD
ncbi:NUDIX domain-containing protein [Ktedonosporobacter rubrisoli]|uniref:NUDIX domain-containing protein n=1 Tax=Ktedonosporobacter rubrisoli TaxID=2509675 RepID=A0A4P6JHT6_KTERU|nr:NUDIX hydrolase [Ktedonosporobacter rubrisoli]QBD74595.1 NUDIX domain-containing protein [Ktedonosporobacter rubrisoli]